MIHGRVKASCLKHSLGNIWMYSTVFISRGSPLFSKEFKKETNEAEGSSCCRCWSVGSSEHRGQQESLTVCCHHMAQRQVLGLRVKIVTRMYKNGALYSSYHRHIQLIVQSQHGSGCAAAPPGLVSLLSVHCNFV